jgi:hypothetical protein
LVFYCSKGGIDLSSKEEHADAVATERARAAKQEYILKWPKADSFSATNPAYTYTSLCPDSSLRTCPVRKKVQYEA